jgi:hypothetical protein
MVNEGIDRDRLIGAADVESAAVRRRRREVPVPQPDEIAAALRATCATCGVRVS